MPYVEAALAGVVAAMITSIIGYFAQERALKANFDVRAIELKTNLDTQEKQLKANLVAQERELKASFEAQERALRGAEWTQYRAEQAVLHLLQIEKWQLRSFREIKNRIGGFKDDDDLRQILVRAGAVKFVRNKDKAEMWGLISRNLHTLNVNVMKEDPPVEDNDVS